MSYSFLVANRGLDCAELPIRTDDYSRAGCDRLTINAFDVSGGYFRREAAPMAGDTAICLFDVDKNNIMLDKLSQEP